ncbi:hypothetical protein F5H01DRAFT_339857 [Linnemannia elongata]|nr:hypothetical protein F5H01DRAFT_339857 [Linnemannia elongata]
MDNIPVFVRKYVSKDYYDLLDWRERAAYLRGIQDVMNLFNKDLENRAMSVLKRKAHWLEPIETPSSSSFTRPTVSQQPYSLTAPAPALATTLNNARAVPKSWQSTQQSSQSSSQSSSQPLNGSQPTASQPSQSSSQPLKGSQSKASQPSQSSSQPLNGSQSTASQPSQSSTTANSLPKRKETEVATLDTEITFVGMRYRGGHVFSTSDQVKLERDHKNPVDKNAIKVMVLKNGKWAHVAYVARDDAYALKDQLGIENMKLTYLRAFLASVKYRLQA